MARERHIRRTYAGRPAPRRPLYPGLLRRKQGGPAPIRLPRLAAQGLLIIALALVATMGGLAATAFGAYSQVAASLKPRLAALENRTLFQTSRILDRNGELLYEFFDAGRRTKVGIDQISPLLIQATVAIEDKTFFTNPGVDVEGIARTIIKSLEAGEETGGASTITQQVIKSIVLSDEERAYENRYQRKLKEIILAQELDQRYTKNQILEIYLNEIFYGNLAYGIEAAADAYFNTTAQNLSLAQAALLAGLPQSPSRYNPINYLLRDERGGYLPGVALGDGWQDPAYALPDGLPPPKWRQIAVLRQMVDEGYITADQGRAAAAAQLRFAPQEVPLNAPHFVFYVRDLLQEKYDLNGTGLTITTTIDLDLQRMVQRKAAERIAELEQRNIHNAAVVVLQPNTSQILAMVGSIDYNAVVPTRTPGETGNVLDGQVNVTTRERQPGSALKPFTYLAAMEKGLSPGSVLWDVPTEFPVGNGDWYAPQNYNGRWNGPVRIRTALANSLNMPAVKALKYAGITRTLELLDRVGIKTGLKRGADFYGLSLTLGGGEVTPLELTTAYNTLASGGRYRPPTPILQITDAEGRVLEQFAYSAGEQVLDPALVSVITDILSDDKARAPVWGLNSPLKLSQPAAVKTGTTNDWRDAWAAGYTPFVTIGVWTGNNNNEPTARVESLSGGGIIWRNVMEEIFTWIKERPRYRALFSAPLPAQAIPPGFVLPSDGSVQSRNICPLPGPYGGYDSELFTKTMITRVLSPTNILRPTGTPDAPPRRRDAALTGCDVYEKLQVVVVPPEAADRVFVGTTEVTTGTQDLQSPRYCLPVEGAEYPAESLTTITIWNLPPPDPDEKVVYRWEGGGALDKRNLQPCPEDLFAPAPPMAGAILMPDLSRLGENQAKDVLARLGVTNIYVDYQGRDRIPDIYDDYLPYTVVSTLPRPDDWILPGTTVVLGIRAPDPGLPPAQPQPAPLEPSPSPPVFNAPPAPPPTPAPTGAPLPLPPGTAPGS